MKIRQRVVRWVWIAAISGTVGATYAGCSANSSTGGQADLITQNDIAVRGLVAESAYEIVERLRPRWLRQRGITSFQNPEANYAVVYVDGTRYGEPALLRQIRADEISTIRFLNGTDATTRYGTNHDGGAILVVTAR